MEYIIINLTKDQKTPLLYAMQCGNHNIVSQLVSHGSDPNTVVNELEMPILPSVKGEIDKIKLLVEFKLHLINVNCINKQGDTPLHFILL
jgi:ankyrin repeat protein